MSAVPARARPPSRMAGRSMVPARSSGEGIDRQLLISSAFGELDGAFAGPEPARSERPAQRRSAGCCVLVPTAESPDATDRGHPSGRPPVGARGVGAHANRLGSDRRRRWLRAAVHAHSDSWAW
jgi:hypothetical protein